MSGETAAARPDRKIELSWLNLAFCLLVVWIHCASHPVAYLQRESWQFLLIYSAQRLSFVAVYGFFFVSGLKFTLPRSRPRTLASYWRGRAASILLPYCLSVAVYYLLTNWYLGAPLSLSELLGHLVLGDMAAHYYFLIALFQFILLAPLFLWLSRRWSPVLLLPLSLVVTLTCQQYLPDILHLFLPGYWFPYNGLSFTTYLFYYLAGCCAGQHYEEFIRLVERDRGLIDAVCALSGIFVTYLFWLSATDRYYAPFLNLIHTLYISTGILVCFQIALRLPRRMPRWLARLDQVSYLIYLYHCLFLMAADVLLGRLGIVRVGHTFLLRTAFAFTATPLACAAWRSLTDRRKKEI